MNQYSLKERVFLVKSYYQLKYPISVQRKWKTTFTSRPPTTVTINNLIAKFERTGMVNNDTSKSGRPRSVRDDNSIAEVKNAIFEEPTSSIRRLSADNDLSKSTVHRILKKDLKLKPFHPRLVHLLMEDDFDRRLQFCEIFPALNDENPEFIDQIWWSDEACFKLSGIVNRHNSIYWAETNPNLTYEKAMKAPGLTVWAAISSRGLIGPFFFNETVNGNNYLQMLQESFLPALQGFEAHEDMFFMQDGAPPHYATVVRDWLDLNFAGKWIGRRGSVEWPARSPDLTPPDFFLWGYVKNFVYGLKPQTLVELEQIIRQCCTEIPVEMLTRACRSVLNRCQLCIDNQGGQFEFKKT